MDDNQVFLSKLAIFSGLDADALASVAKMFKERHYRRNELIFVEEDTGQYMYVVKAGRVKVSRTLPNGRETILTFHKEGEYFGEMSLIDGETTPANVTAVVPTTILLLGRQDFSTLLENPTINAMILKALCRRCREAWTQISVLAFHHADARIRAVLYYLGQNRGTATGQGIRINLHLTHRELAEMAGISRETVTRVLGQLQNEEVLEVEEGHFLISNPAKLVEPLLLT